MPPDREALPRLSATSACRCWGCGADDPMTCGSLCADCSWESHLAGMAHTGDFDEPREDTPTCCLRTRETERARWGKSA
jgi:hypothetical protein